MYGSEWFKVYDIIEALHATFARNDENNGQQDAVLFAEAIKYGPWPVHAGDSGSPTQRP